MENSDLSIPQGSSTRSLCPACSLSGMPSVAGAKLDAQLVVGRDQSQHHLAVLLGREARTRDTARVDELDLLCAQHRNIRECTLALRDCRAVQHCDRSE